MKPAEFWNLTPSDIKDLLKGWTKKQEYLDNKADVRLAYALVHLLRPHVKKGAILRLDNFMIKWKRKRKKKEYISVNKGKRLLDELQNRGKHDK